MKKTIALILAIALSMTLFATDIAGISMIVRADDSYEDAYEMDDDGDPGQDTPDDDQSEEVRKAEEEARKKAEEEEEAKRKAAEEAEEAQKKAEDEEKAKAAAEDEAAKEEAYKKAAEEAEEAARKAAEDEAAKEAQKKAEYEAELAEREAEAAREAAEAKKKAEEAMKYALVATVNSSEVSSVNFGSAQVGEQRDTKSVTITNVGQNAVDVIYTKTSDPDGAFYVSLAGGSTHLESGESMVITISMSYKLGVGDYAAYAAFADASRDPKFERALKIALKGSVTPNRPTIRGISVSPSKTTVSPGSTTRFSADVDGEIVGYTIVWAVTGNRSAGTVISSDGVLSVASDETANSMYVMASITADMSIKSGAEVYVRRDGYTVNAYADPSYGGKVTGGGAVADGGSVTLTAIPSRNFLFDGWYADDVLVSENTNFRITDIHDNYDFTARFSQNYVTVDVGSNDWYAGDVIGGGTIPYKGSTTLAAKARDGYVFIGWKEDGSFISKDAYLRLDNVKYDRYIVAIFEKTRNTLTLVCDPAKGGTVSGGGTFGLNEGTTIKAVPAPGFVFQGWQVNGQFVSRNAQYRIDRIPQDITCTAVFTPTGVQTFEISSGVATTGGSINPSGKLTVGAGQNVNFTITPKSGFAILAVSVDGVQVGPVSTYTLSNIQANHVIAAAFIQTDAGKTNSETSGKLTQTSKVTELPKTLNNTATNQTTVNLEEAASGVGGDNYVEEMDLSTVEIPSEEALAQATAADETTVAADSSEVVKVLGKTMDELTTMIDDGDTIPILHAAYYTGGLSAFVYNNYEPLAMLSGGDYSNMTDEQLAKTDDEKLDPSLPNLDEVIRKMLTSDDVMKLVKGGHVDVSVSITKQENPDEADKRIMQNAVGKKSVQYFDVTMLKTVDGTTARVNDISTAMKVVMEIPDDIYKEGKTYTVLRVHDGQLTNLPDMDNDPKTITFMTDRFSSYSIAQEVTTANGIIAWLVAGAALAFGVAVTCLLILVAHQRKIRRMKRARHEVQRY